MVLIKPAACLAAAFVLTAADPGAAQSQTAQAPPMQTQAPQQAGSGPPQQPEQPKPETGRKGRTTRTPRTPKRRPTPPPAGFDQTRPSRDGGPTRNQLALAANILGGYDDNVTAGLGSGTGTTPAAMASGGTGYMDASLKYFHGNSLRSVGIDSTGSLTAYPGYLDHPAPGAFVNLSGRMPVGRNTTFGASQRVGYEPLFNVFSPGASGTPLPPEIGQSVPATNLFERNSWSSNSSVALDRRWSREDSTSLAYAYRLQRFTENDFGNNTWHTVTANYWRALSRGFRAGPRYWYENGEYIDSAEFARPTIQHRIEGAGEFESALSRRRHLRLALTAGAGYLESVSSTTREPFRSWMPVGTASLLVGLSPGWSLEGGYQRDLSLLQGVTDEVYKTDTAFVSAGRLVTESTDVRVGATYSNWKTPIASGVYDNLNVYGASLQVRVKLTATVAATAAYYYYQHRYSNPAALPEGFPAEYDRNAVRVGLTVWVPLAGTPQRTQR
jgi:hypothetical protein